MTRVDLLFHQLSLPTHACGVIPGMKLSGQGYLSGNNISEGAGLDGMVNICELL